MKPKTVARYKCGAPMLASLTIMLSDAHAAYAQHTVGYVLEVRGEWFVSGSPPQRVSRGRALLARDTLWRGQQRSINDRLTVVLADGEPITRQCWGRREAQCDTAIVLGEAGSGGSVFARVLAAVMDHVRQDPGAIVPVMSRGSGSPKEAVVPLRGNLLDLRPALVDVLEGDYQLVLTPVPSLSDHTTKAASSDSIRIPYSWQIRRPSPVQVHGVMPGLYELSLSRDPGASALILISDDRDYAHLRAAFDEAEALTQRWAGKVHDDQIRGFLGTYLYHLASEPKR